MKILISLVFVMCLSFSVMASENTKEKPTQHLNVADVTTMKDAKEIFLGKTYEIIVKKNIITYTLEKSVAYFAENLTGEKQSLAKEMAVVVESIHLTSESNRLEELQTHLKEYFNLVDKFLFCF